MATLDNPATDPHSDKPLVKMDKKAITTKAISDRSPVIINRILDYIDKYHDSDDENRRKEVKAFELKILDKMMPKEVRIKHNVEGYIEGNLAKMLTRMSNGTITDKEAQEIECEIVEDEEDV